MSLTQNPIKDELPDSDSDIDMDSISELIRRAEKIIEENRGNSRQSIPAELHREVMEAIGGVPDPETIPPELDRNIEQSHEPSPPLEDLAAALPIAPPPPIAEDDDVIYVASEPANRIIDLSTPDSRRKRRRRSSRPIDDIVFAGSPLFQSWESHLHPRCLSQVVLPYNRSQSQSSIVIHSHPQTQPLPKSNNAQKTHSTIQQPAPTENNIPTGSLTLTCPVCMDTCRKPTSTFCGHVFCDKCIKQAIKCSSKCPLCNRKISATMTHPLYF